MIGPHVADDENGGWRIEGGESDLHPPSSTLHPRVAARAPITVQATYYIITGIWPLVHLASFEAVTGSKTDDWLVQTVGALVIVIGATLAVAATRLRGRPSPELLTLALGAAIAFIAVDVGFVLSDAIGPIYLADAGVQAALVVWIVARLS